MNRDRATISRQSGGPIYANSYALRGLGVRYTEPFPIPGPVVLPVAWRMPQLPPVDKFRFNSSKEREVLEQAAIRRRAIVGEAGNMQQPARPDVYNRVESFPLSSSIPLIPYLSSAVLTPTRVPSSEGGDGSQTTISQGGGGNVTGSSTGAPASHQSITQPLGELSLKDFEGAADPFEMTTLQAIDVIAELQDVLQPSSSSIPTSATPSIATSQTPSVTQSSPSPTAHLRSVQPVAPSGSPTPPTPRANRVEIAPTTSGYAPPSIGYPTAGYALPTTSSYAPPPTTIGYPPLIDIGLVGASPSQAQPKPQASPPPPRPPKPHVTFNVPPVPARDSAATDPVPSQQRQPYAGVPVLPSMSSPGTQQRQPFAGGVSVLPPIPQSQQPPPVTPPPYQQLSGVPPPSEPVLPPYPSDSEPYLPPYPSDELSSYPQQDENLYGSRPYRLPDDQASLSSEMKESLRNISGMGFPSPRVARALKRCDGDSQKVFDFLLLVGELVDKGYNGDSAEMALISHDEKIDKSTEYLNQVERYKELWSETSIHSAYQQAGKDWDKTVDILTQGTS